MEGDRSHVCDGLSVQLISIHSLRMEGDFKLLYALLDAPISIHSLRMEGDCLSCLSSRCGSQFQSTPSAWRET